MGISRKDLGFETNADDVAELFKDEIAGKTVVITGASPNSLGSEFALSIAAYSPKLIIVTGRTSSKIEDISKLITNKNPNVQVKGVELELTSLDSARKAGQEILNWEDVPVVDVLVNNAGVMAGPYQASKDGFEGQFAINHLAHFVFTKTIFPKILAAAKIHNNARVVNVSSNGHLMSPIHWDNIGFDDGKTYNQWDAYGQSKTANVLFSVGLAEKFGDRGVYSYSLHPGMILETSLGRSVSEDIIKDMLETRAPEPEVETKFKTLQQGSATHVVAAFDPEIKDLNGKYFVNSGIAPPSRVSEFALDKNNAERLWKLTEDLTGEKFE